MIKYKEHRFPSFSFAKGILAELWKCLRSGKFVGSMTNQREFVVGDIVNPDDLTEGSLLGYIVTQGVPTDCSIATMSIGCFRRITRLKQIEDFNAGLAALSEQSEVTRVMSNRGHVLFCWVAPSAYRKLLEAA